MIKWSRVLKMRSSLLSKRTTVADERSSSISKTLEGNA
jgi:hypothetical protein